MLALTDLGYVYLFKRSTILDVASKKENLLIFKPGHSRRILGFRFLGNLLEIEDIKVINFEDAYILARNSPYIYYFKLQGSNTEPIFKSRFEYGFNAPGSKLPLNRKINFDMR